MKEANNLLVKIEMEIPLTCQKCSRHTRLLFALCMENKQL